MFQLKDVSEITCTFENGEIIRALLSGCSLEELPVNPKTNRLTLSRGHKADWSTIAQEVTQSLDALGIKYVLIKVFDVPYARMEDVDLLIEDEGEVIEVLAFLRKKGFSIFRDQYSTDPFKITAFPSHVGIQVDIYSKPAWFNMRYASDFFVTSHRTKRTACGVEAYMPEPTLDLYLVATHSYNHGFVSLAEVAHIVQLILNNQIDWGFLETLAETYKLRHAVYLSLRLAQLSFSQYENSRELQRFLSNLEQDRLTKLYSEIFTKLSRNGFPLKIPLYLRLLSAFTRIFRPNLKFRTKTYDELFGYFLALVFRGNKKLVTS